MDDLFDNPGKLGGSFKAADHEGRLVLIWPLAIKQYTDDDGTRDVTEADVVVLDPPGGSGPLKHEAVTIFPRVLQGQLRRNVGTGRPNLGRIHKGVPLKPRQTAPWELADPTEAEKNTAREYLRNPNATPAPMSSSSSSSSSGAGFQGGEPPF